MPPLENIIPSKNNKILSVERCFHVLQLVCADVQQSLSLLRLERKAAFPIKANKEFAQQIRMQEEQCFIPPRGVSSVFNNSFSTC